MARIDVLTSRNCGLTEPRTKPHSTNPLKRLNGEIKRRTNVVGIFPNEAAITRLIGAILMEQNDEWAVQRARYMTLETIAPIGHDDLSGARRSYTTPRDTIRLGDVLIKPERANISEAYRT
jgi:hypothetical protein